MSQESPGCAHTYTADYSHRTKGVGVRCPYPAFYERLRSDASRASGSDTDLELPMDESGLCIFHSRDAEWKRENDFGKRLVQLLEFLEIDEKTQRYDFAEFVFVGNLPRSETEAGKPVFRFKDHRFPKAVYLTCLLYTSPSPRDRTRSRMPSSA